jgi:hypothetical protein
MAKDENESQQQPYDRALKSLMEDHAAEMVPELVPGARFIEEKNNELTRLNLRADIVYLIDYKGELRILNMELQTEAEKHMAFRMLVYSLELYDKYEPPIISVVLYPFETSIPEPVFEMAASSKTHIRFDHDVLCLWTIEAEPFLRRQIVSMYTLLPAMKGITAPMLVQAIAEMEQAYIGEHLKRHLRRFRTILRRSRTLSAQDKQIVEGKMRSYDSLLESDPEFQQKMAEAILEGQQKFLMLVVKKRFPALLQQAQQKAVRLQKEDDLYRLTELMIGAPDEKTAQWVLDTFAA